MPYTRAAAALLVKKAAERKEVSREEKGEMLALIQSLPPERGEPELFTYCDEEDILDSLRGQLKILRGQLKRERQLSGKSQETSPAPLLSWSRPMFAMLHPLQAFIRANEVCVLTGLEEKMDKLLILTEINSSLQMDQFMFTEGKISAGNKHFSSIMKQAYWAQTGDQCWCLLMNDMLPGNTVIGAHLFKHKWKDHVHVIGIDDIDDTRNGLPLWKPVEWAFDTSRYAPCMEVPQFMHNIYIYAAVHLQICWVPTMLCWGRKDAMKILPCVLSIIEYALYLGSKQRQPGCRE